MTEPRTAVNDNRVVAVVTPAGALHLRADADGEVVDAAIVAAFAEGAGAGLLRLGAAEVTTALPAALAWWRELAVRYVTAVCARGEARPRAIAPPSDEVLAAIAGRAPPMLGGEYVDAALLAAQWRALDAAFLDAVDGGAVADWLAGQHPSWHLVGRVHFNLAENRGDDEAPFAFIATYTARLSAKGKAQHIPLGQARRELAGHPDELLALLAPVSRAAEACEWLRAMVDSDEIYYPLRWTPADALALLRDAAALEQAGVIIRMPQGWGGARPPRAQATATVGATPPGGLGADALLDFQTSVSVDGAPLTAAEIAALLDGEDGLRLLRGRWIEIDREQLRATIDRLHAAARAAKGGVGFAEALRALAGAALDRGGGVELPAAARVVPGPWLAETLRGLRGPDGLAAVDPGPELRGTLRPYQAVGLRWLHLSYALRSGACLADDMGLGKTVQIIALLLVARRQAGVQASVLVVPASLLGNWTAELARFAPSLRVVVAHPSAMERVALTAADPPALDATDLVITSYGTLARSPWLAKVRWRLVIVDEAQAIKNPGARQTRAVKTLAADARIAVTGTPVENQLGDLWSIFDFLNPGLLGTAKEFTRYTRELERRDYGALRELVKPYLLRRLKTDRAVIADLPDKTELIAYCALTRKQAALYQGTIDDLAHRLRASKGIERKGVVLATLTRLKQICNHPAHGLDGGAWPEADSGKLARVRELAEVIAARQEKLLVFTQFREATAPLASFLAGVFGRPGLVLHGSVAVKERAALVRRFQDDDAVPFFVLSLKAGGTGLNLTAASHVVHFDRWWNPAVEDQATDRAFRIGQQRNVLVHKLVCRGTVEEKIEAMIADKRALSRSLLEGTGELKLTELSDAELLQLVALDLRSATAAAEASR